MKSGMLIYEESNSRSAGMQSTNLVYDHYNNTFYSFNVETDSIRCHQVTVKNFKKVASNAIDTDVSKILQKYEQARVENWIAELKKDKEEKPEIKQLSLLEKLMQDVTS